ncbi:MAG: DUF362 domain-containing protein [Candidatus Poribacteria bacterium]
MTKKITRKAFLKRAAAIGIGARITSLPIKLTEARTETKSRVIIAINESVRDSNGKVVQAIVDRMLGNSIKKLADTNNAEDAWRRIFKPTDVVGIKINCLGGPGIYTSKEVVSAIIKGLRLVNIPEENIIIWDRTERDLRKCRYKINRNGSGVRCYGTLPSVGYEEQPTRMGEFEGRLSKILTQKITALINAPILKDHNLAGITGTMKNHYGSFSNPQDYHANTCDPYIADLNAIPLIKEKTRLLVYDAIRPLADGGPVNKAGFRWDYNGLLTGFDPVAVDYQGWRIIEARRRELGLPSLEEAGRPPKYLDSAAKRGVGTNDPEKIESIYV